MDAKTRKNIEYLIILLISAAVLAVGWSNRKIIAGWGNQNTEDASREGRSDIGDRFCRRLSDICTERE